MDLVYNTGYALDVLRRNKQLLRELNVPTLLWTYRCTLHLTPVIGYIYGARVFLGVPTGLDGVRAGSRGPVWKRPRLLDHGRQQR